MLGSFLLLCFASTPFDAVAWPPVDCAIGIQAKQRVGTSIGAGFLARLPNRQDEWLLITAYHVLYGTTSATLVVDATASTSVPIKDIVTNRCHFDLTNDIIVLECTSAGRQLLRSLPHPRYPITLGRGRIAAGAPVATIGSPNVRILGKERTFWNLAVHSTLTAYSKRGDVLDRLFHSLAPEQEILLLESLQVTSGFSGGPIVYSASNFHEDDSQLAGMVQGGDPTQNGLWCWAVPAFAVFNAVQDYSSGRMGLTFPPERWDAPLISDAVFANATNSILDIGDVSPGVVIRGVGGATNGQVEVRSSAANPGSAPIIDALQLQLTQFAKSNPPVALTVREMLNLRLAAAVVAINRTDYKSALQFVTDQDVQAARSDKDSDLEIRLRQILGDAFYRMRQWAQATAHYKPVLEIDTNATRIAFKLANCLAMTENFEEAKALYDRVVLEYRSQLRLQANPQRKSLLAGVLANRAGVLFKLNMVDESMKDLDEAIAVLRIGVNMQITDPYAAIPLNNRANIFRMRGRWDEAIADLTAAANLLKESVDDHGDAREQVEYANILSNRAHTYEEIGDRKRAAKDFETVGELLAKVTTMLNASEADELAKQIQQGQRRDRVASNNCMVCHPK